MKQREIFASGKRTERNCNHEWTRMLNNKGTKQGPTPMNHQLRAYFNDKPVSIASSQVFFLKTPHFYPLKIVAIIATPVWPGGSIIGGWIMEN
jgi:hypothetical protein